MTLYFYSPRRPNPGANYAVECGMGYPHGTTAWVYVRADNDEQAVDFAIKALATENQRRFEDEFGMRVLADSDPEETEAAIEEALSVLLPYGPEETDNVAEAWDGDPLAAYKEPAQ